MAALILVAQSEIQTDIPREVKRFQDIIGAYERNQPETVQEKLITLRARFVLAEKRLHDLETSTAPVEEGRLKKPLEMKALKAEMDHYTKLIARIENAVIQDKRKERARQVKKSTQR